MIAPYLMIANTYKTIADKTEGIYKSKGSKFLAFGYPVSSEDEINKIISELKKKHHAARHHCYAYRIGDNKYRINDDGEPSNTAGKPIYSQILSNDLTNILIVVVRYFGGILLGTGGLITSYKSAAINMLQNAKIISKTIYKLYKIDFDYTVMDKIFKIIKEENLEQVDKSLDIHCFVVTKIDISKEKMIISRFEQLKNVSTTLLETI